MAGSLVVTHTEDCTQANVRISYSSLDSATASLADAINRCDLQTAYDIIKEMDIEKIDKSKRIFNVAINYYGDLNRQESVEEAPVEDKDEFKYVHSKLRKYLKCGPQCAVYLIVGNFVFGIYFFDKSCKLKLNIWGVYVLFCRYLLPQIWHECHLSLTCVCMYVYMKYACVFVWHKAECNQHKLAHALVENFGENIHP